eukprot:jgi/Ulvmu1/12092/UM084_0015.1
MTGAKPMEVHSARPGSHGYDDAFSAIVSGLSPEAMVPERTESVSKAGARIMLEECLHHKLEKLAGQPVPTQMILALTQERDKILVSSMRAFIPTHRKPCLGGGFNPRSHKASQNKRRKSPARLNTVHNSSRPPEAPASDSQLRSQPINAMLPSESIGTTQTARRCTSAHVPAYVMQDPAYASSTSAATSPPRSAPPSRRPARKSNSQPPQATHHTATGCMQPTFAPEDSFIQQDTSLAEESSADFTAALSVHCPASSPHRPRHSYPMPHPRTTATPITLPHTDPPHKPTHNTVAGPSTRASPASSRRPATASAAPAHHFSPSPRRILSAHNGRHRHPSYRPPSSTAAGKDRIACTNIELAVKRVQDTNASAAARPRAPRPATSPGRRARTTYSPPARSASPDARAASSRAQLTYSALSRLSPHMHDRQVSPPRQIHSAPARGRACTAAAGIAAARVAPHEIASGPAGEGILPSYTLRFALGMEQRVEEASLEPHSARACSTLYTPSTPLDPRKVSKLGRAWSADGGGAAAAAGLRVASSPLVHAHEGPRGAAGDAAAAVVDGSGGGGLLRQPSSFAAVLNYPRFNTQGAAGEFRPSSARSSTWECAALMRRAHSSASDDETGRLQRASGSAPQHGSAAPVSRLEHGAAAPASPGADASWSERGPAGVLRDVRCGQTGCVRAIKAADDAVEGGAGVEGVPEEWSGLWPLHSTAEADAPPELQEGEAAVVIREAEDAHWFGPGDGEVSQDGAGDGLMEAGTGAGSGEVRPPTEHDREARTAGRGAGEARTGWQMGDGSGRPGGDWFEQERGRSGGDCDVSTARDVYEGSGRRCSGGSGEGAGSGDGSNGGLDATVGLDGGQHGSYMEAGGSYFALQFEEDPWRGNEGQAGGECGDGQEEAMHSLYDGCEEQESECERDGSWSGRHGGGQADAL